MQRIRTRVWGAGVWSVGPILIALGLMLMATGFHDAAMPEDLTTVWMCHHMGNNECGSETSWIQLNPTNLLYNWDMVYSYWFGA